MSRFQSSLEGKAGIVTGGSSGFGYAISRGLVGQGARVAAFSMDELSHEALAEIRSQGKTGKGAFEHRHQDITLPGASESMVEQTVELFGKIDFVIANAGFAMRFEEPLLEMPLDRLSAAMKMQFEVFPVAFATLALAAARVMAPRFEAIPADDMGHRSDSGSIVVTLSEAALCPLRDDLLAYAAAKRACLSIMESLSGVLGPRNIRVNGIAPGFANTAGPRKFYDRYPKIKEDIEAQNHLAPSFIDPGAVVPAVLYLLTDNYVTGEVIRLDGGFSIQMKKYFQGK